MEWLINIIQDGNVIAGVLAAITAAIISLIGWLIMRSLVAPMNELKDKLSNLSVEVGDLQRQIMQHTAQNNIDNTKRSSSLDRHLVHYEHTEQDVCSLKQKMEVVGKVMGNNMSDIKILEERFETYEERFEQFANETKEQLRRFGDKVDTIGSSYEIVASILKTVADTNKELSEQLKEFKNGRDKK